MQTGSLVGAISTIAIWIYLGVTGKINDNNQDRINPIIMGALGIFGFIFFISKLMEV